MDFVRSGTVALVLCAGIGLAAAQSSIPVESLNPGDTQRTTTLQLTPVQKAAMVEAIRRDSAKVTAPPNFVVSVGAPVPPVTELYVLPEAALSAAPEAKIVKYTVVQNQIVLVDPTTMRVVEVFNQ